MTEAIRRRSESTSSDCSDERNPISASTKPAGDQCPAESPTGLQAAVFAVLLAVKLPRYRRTTASTIEDCHGRVRRCRSDCNSIDQRILDKSLIPAVLDSPIISPVVGLTSNQAVVCVPLIVTPGLGRSPSSPLFDVRR